MRTYIMESMIDTQEKRQYTSDEISRLLGQKLLQGWKMLSDPCPNCLAVPVVENINSKQFVCVGCGSEFTKEVDSNNTNRYIYKLKNITKNQTTKNQNQNENENENENPNSNANMQKSSINIDHLQQPLKDMKMDYEESEQSSGRDYELIGKKQKLEDKNDITSLIGEKLLQGWTLLGDLCPNPKCVGIPLMRERLTKKMLCLNCNHYVVFEGKTPNSSSILPIPNLNIPLSQQQQQQQSIFVGQKLNQQNQELTSLDTGTYANNDIWKKDVEMSISVLFSKLNDSKRLLEATKDIEEGKSLCSFISTCSSTLVQLFELKKQI